MRKNSRDHILSAALSVLDREGPGALTFEAISQESGLTKRGLIYHFSCRAELVDALHAHLAKRWDQEIAENVALPVVEPAERARHLAYVQACTHGASVHRLHFMLSGWKCPSIAARWLSVLEHWSPDTPARPDHHAAVRRFVARLACEGLKAHLSLASKPIDPSIRDAVAIEIAALMYPEIGGFELALSYSRGFLMLELFTVESLLRDIFFAAGFVGLGVASFFVFRWIKRRNATKKAARRHE